MLAVKEPSLLVPSLESGICASVEGGQEQQKHTDIPKVLHWPALENKRQQSTETEVSLLARLLGSSEEWVFVRVFVGLH